MCGFVCLIDNKNAVLQDILRNMNTTLHHRGPDDESYWISNDSKVGFAHKRLSIIDLSVNARQPMFNEDKSLILVYNGEIYNYIVLKKRLMEKGHLFRSNSDSEVILHAYEEWSFSCINLFNGIFSFVIWDDKKKILFGGRDRYGVKPMYIYRKNNILSIASESKAFLKLPSFNKEINHNSLYMYLQLRAVPSGMSIWKDCFALKPANYFVYDNNTNNFSVKRYWYPDAMENTLTISDENEVIEICEEKIYEAVTSQLMSEVPLGLFLSGGIDSSLILAMMAKNKTKINSFTIGFEEQTDEAPYARKIANHFGTHHTEMYLSNNDLLDIVLNLPSTFSEPFADSSAIPTFAVSQLAKKSVTVTLSGDGADELFFGYQDLYTNVESLEKRIKLPLYLRKKLSKLDVIFPWGNISKGLGLFDFEDRMDLFLKYRNTWQKNELCLLLLEKAIPLKGTNNYRFMQNKSFSENMLLHDFLNYLPNELLVKVDRASMSSSLETRVPFLDNNFVDFSLALPLQFRIRNNNSKYLLKKILNKYVPIEYIERPKRGFGAPLDFWLKNILSFLLEEYLSERVIKKQNIFRWEMVDKTVREFKNGNIKHYRVWSLVVFQMWYEKYIENYI